MDDELYRYWDITRVAPSVIMGLSCILGVPGNMVVLITVWRTFESKNFTTRLILNLALCDLLVLLCLPLTMYNLMKDWDLGPVTCKLLFFLLQYSLNASVMTITLLSVHRYIQVLYPLRWAQLGRTGEEALLVVVWGLPGVIACFCFFVHDIKTQAGHRTCRTDYKTGKQEAIVLFFQTLLGFVFPCCILVTSYFCLHRRVSQATLFRQQRLTKLVTSILVAFFSFWTPLHLFNMLALGNIGLKSETVGRVCLAAFDFLTAFSVINSCLNPFLYSFASSDFRRDAPRIIST